MMIIKKLFWPKLALRELRNNRKFSLFFILNLAMGLSGFIALDSFKESLDLHLGKNSKAILGADIALTTYFPFQEENIKYLESNLPENTKVTRRISLFTMVSSIKKSRLVEVIGVEELFPFYGKIFLKNNGIVQDDNHLKKLNLYDESWVYPELLNILNLSEDENIKIGEKNFLITDLVMDDPSSSMSSFGFAPRIYVGFSKLKETGLLTKKSRVSYQRLYSLPKGANLESIVEKLKNNVKNLKGSDSKIRIISHKNAGNNLGRLLGYLNDYLGLVALIAIFLAGIGAAYLYRNYLSHHFRELSILMSLGATRQQTYQMVLWQLLFLGTGASLIAILISIIILPFLPLLLEQFLPRGFVTHISLSSLFFSIFIGCMGSFVFCLPVLSRIRSVKPLYLFHEHFINNDVEFKLWQQWYSYIPLIMLSWFLSVWQSHSWVVGSIFIVMLILSIIVLCLVALVILRIVGDISQNLNSVVIRLAFRNINRNRLGAISCFLALSMGTLLINLIPQIYQGLQEEISRPKDFRIPSLFMFDIQPDQIEALKKLISEENEVMKYISPMVRARLEKINNEVFKSFNDDSPITREQEREQRFRMRTLNLSYRTELSESEYIVRGQPFSSKYDWDSGLPSEVSIEERYADRFGLKIGDTLTFNVQEILIDAKIVNFRRVKWNSFQPNFFILFQPGVLEEAPATFLASLGGLDQFKRIKLQNKIVNKFPNVSVVDVNRTVKRILSISDQMVLALKLMAYLSIFAGLIVVFSIARNEVEGRLWELNLLKVLGAKFNDIQKMIQFEFLIIGFFACIFGVSVSTIMSYGLAWWFFENFWQWTWGISIMSIIGVISMSVIVAWFATRKLLKSSPLTLLRSS